MGSRAKQTTSRILQTIKTKQNEKSIHKFRNSTQI